MLQIFTSIEAQGNALAMSYVIRRNDVSLVKAASLTIHSHPVGLLEAHYRAAYAALMQRLSLPTNERTTLFCERELHAELTRAITPANRDRWESTYRLLFALPQQIDVRLSGELVGQYLADNLVMQMLDAPTPIGFPTVPRGGLEYIASTLRAMLRPEGRERLARLLIMP